MASGNTTDTKLKVEIIKKTVVKATDPSPQPHIIHLSNLDLLSGRFPVTYIYFYPKNTHINDQSINKKLKGSLKNCLEHFYPFAGRVCENQNSNEPEIICDNTGALVIEARANILLKEFDFYDLNQSLQGKLVTVDHQFPVQIQITNFTCGGIAITFTFDHALGDAYAFGKFLSTWSEIASGKPITCTPAHGRNLHARVPPTYDPSMDNEFISSGKSWRTRSKKNINIARLGG